MLPAAYALRLPVLTLPLMQVCSRLDGTKYAVKRSVRELHSPAERRAAAAEAQALAAVGAHPCVVREYYIRKQNIGHSLPLWLASALALIAQAARFRLHAGLVRQAS